MNGFLIGIITIFTILMAIVLTFIVNLIFIWQFSKKLKEHKKALTILLVQKYESFESIFEIYSKNNIKVKKSLKDMFASIDIANFDDLDSLESVKDRNSLSLLKQELLGIVKNNDDFQKNEEFQLAVKMLNGLDEQFRYVVAAYNADVIGYNYWVRFRLFKHLFLFNHVGLKEIIS